LGGRERENPLPGDIAFHCPSSGLMSGWEKNLRTEGHRFKEQTTRFRLRRARRKMNHREWYMSSKPRMRRIL